MRSKIAFLWSGFVTCHFNLPEAEGKTKRCQILELISLCLWSCHILDAWIDEYKYNILWITTNLKMKQSVVPVGQSQNCLVWSCLIQDLGLCWKLVLVLSLLLRGEWVWGERFNPHKYVSRNSFWPYAKLHRTKIYHTTRSFQRM